MISCYFTIILGELGKKGTGGTGDWGYTPLY